MKLKLLFIPLIVFSNSIFAQIIPNYIPTNGLVGWYPFNNNANDESGNGNNATYIGTGVTSSSDRFSTANSSYYFSGATGDYIRIPADNFPTTDRTISLWFNLPTVTNHPMLLGYGGGSCSGYGDSFLMGINISGNGNYESQAHYNSNLINQPYSADPINVWTNWVITISGTSIQMYIDGVLATANGTFSYPTIVAGKDLVFGVMPWCNGIAPYTDVNGDYTQGNLDDIAIWNRALSQTEITNVFTGINTVVQLNTNTDRFFVYPNPSKDQLNIQLNNSTNGISFNIKDISGRVVMTGYLNQGESKIDIKDLSSGMYFLTDETTQSTIRFVKE